MLESLTVILVCQLIGEIVTRMANLPVPGPVLGMALLFVLLTFRKGVSREMESVTGFLHRYLSLLFVPAGVGIITNLDLLVKSWAPLAGAVIIGTAVTIAVTAFVMQSLNRRVDRGKRSNQ